MAHGLGVLMDQQGEPDAARRLFERSLAIWRELGDRGEEARQLNSLGITYRHLGQMATARAFLEEAVALNRLGPARESATAAEWDAWLAAGRALSQPEALALLRSLISV